MTSRRLGCTVSYGPGLDLTTVYVPLISAFSRIAGVRIAMRSISSKYFMSHEWHAWSVGRLVVQVA